MIQPRTIKQDLLRGQKIDKWTRDVWLLTEHDQGSLIQGGPNDIFLFQLKQNSGAGYLWSFGELESLGFSVISDTVTVPEVTDGVGSPVRRITTAVSTQAAFGNVFRFCATK
jgi:predicted secreted protein